MSGEGVGGKKEVMLADMGVVGCGDRGMERKECVREMLDWEGGRYDGTTTKGRSVLARNDVTAKISSAKVATRVARSQARSISAEGRSGWAAK